MNFKTWAAAAALLATGTAQATCYSLYWADGVLVTETSTAPVDLSLPLNEALHEKFGPGVTMVVSDQGVYCGRQDGPVTHRSLADAVRADVERAALLKTVQQNTLQNTPQNTQMAGAGPAMKTR
ncbi:MAG TPA: hypothetical protein VHL79_14035 [Ramlibacter sp.]|jgi:hypothetical protein|nr:hypothetical protein [Ramlibacter sp.]